MALVPPSFISQSSERTAAISATSSTRAFFYHNFSTSIPNLLRLDTGDDVACRHLKSPLLTLKFTSVSFLDSKIHDGLSQGSLYTIETTGSSTTVSRFDPWDGSAKVAEIKWSRRTPTKRKYKELSGVLVQMRGGRWKSGGDILKAGSAPNCRKFNIPNYPYSLKWKRTGIAYQCTSTAMKAPIATLDPAVGSVPPILLVFETIRSKYDARPHFDHSGVSIVLLDYLIVTALLLVTEPDEWEAVSMPASASDRSTTADSSLYPPFPPQTRTASNNSSCTPTFSPPAPMSSGHWDNIDHGDSLHSTSNLTMRDPDPTSTLGSGRDHDPPSPSTESIFFPPTASAAPSHGYLDPSFYGGDIPPVPKIPLQSAPGDRKSSVAGSGHLRGLPSPPSRQDSVHLSSAKSSDPWPSSPSLLPGHVDVPSSPLLEPLRPPNGSNGNHPNSLTSLSGTYRPLPLPPNKPSDPPYVSFPVEKRLLSLSVRSLPPTPTASSSAASQDPLPQHQTIAKGEKELVDWMQLGTSTHRVPDFQSAALYPPPPAYDSIRFSPVEGQHRVVS